ncbi:MAG: class I SAM-dependent methyltransferase [Candidatus Aminicenantes bacterium]|nr:MAG: class I SAM-dependent methyltransferase [Candidatus Aminicenantes bacterium]
MKYLRFNWLIHNVADYCIKEAIESFAKGKMLDIGCGTKPYKKTAEPFVTEHIGLDHKETLHNKNDIDIFALADDLPFSDGSYDTVLATSLIEHVEEPNRVISEMHRVLKSEGHCIVTTPFMWHLHEEPRDFYRFTKYGLRYLFEKNGFEIERLKSIAGFWVTFGQGFVYYIQRFRRGGKLNPLWWIVPFIGMGIQGVCWLLNRIDHSERFTVTYLVVARKILIQAQKQLRVF